jgi:hypothetical protein
MRGKREFNFPTFFALENWLIHQENWHTRNPARHDLGLGFNPAGMEGSVDELDDAGFDLRAAMAWDVNTIASDCDALVLLPGWRESRGAKAEYALAKALDLDVWFAYPGNAEPSGGWIISRAIKEVNLDV